MDNQGERLGLSFHLQMSSNDRKTAILLRSFFLHSRLKRLQGLGVVLCFLVYWMDVIPSHIPWEPRLMEFGDYLK